MLYFWGKSLTIIDKETAKALFKIYGSAIGFGPAYGNIQAAKLLGMKLLNDCRSLRSASCSCSAPNFCDIWQQKIAVS